MYYAPRLDEVEGVLRNAGVANDDQDEGGEDEVVEAVESIHPSVEIGECFGSLVVR